MKRRITFPPLVTLILAVLVATSSTPAAVVAKHGPSASGAGRFRFLNPNTQQTEIWSFSFEAIANKNGQTRGRARFDNLTAQTQVVVRINCLNVGSSSAVMSGRVLHSNDPHLPKLANVVFAVTDGELLPFPGFDTISPLFSFPGRDCHDGAPLTILPVEDGDIQVHS